MLTESQIQKISDARRLSLDLFDQGKTSGAKLLDELVVEYINLAKAAAYSDDPSTGCACLLDK
jgi:hypothetical protein